jgi:hypothetical protein
MAQFRDTVTELDRLLASAGFERREFFGSFAGDPKRRETRTVAVAR